MKPGLPAFISKNKQVCSSRNNKIITVNPQVKIKIKINGLHGQKKKKIQINTVTNNFWEKVANKRQVFNDLASEWQHQLLYKPQH